MCSEDQDVYQIHDFGNDVSVPESLNLKVLEYVRCTFSKNLWIGLIADMDLEEKEAKINFVHPSLPSTLLFGHKEMVYAGCHF